MSESTNALFRPFSFKGLALPNRIVMAPMTRSFSPDGVPGKNVADYYTARAAHHVGLMVTEGTVINRPSASNDPNVPHFYGAASLAGWKEVVESVHAAGGHIAPQLWHMGIIPYLKYWQPPVPLEGPSGLVMPDKEGGHTMTEEDIQDTVSAFAQAAADAKALGFDLIELHGAHGYLIDQFFWEKLNLRTDKWGGRTLPERSRFAIETVKAVRKAVGEDFPVMLRLSQWKQQDYTAKLAHTPQEMEAWLAPLADAGVDIFHCSQRRYWEPEFEGSELNFAGWAKKLTGKTTVTVGSVGLSGDFLAGFGGEKSHAASIENLLERLEKNEFDLVAVGRGLLANPDWADLIKNNDWQHLKGFDKSLLKTLV